MYIKSLSWSPNASATVDDDLAIFSFKYGLMSGRGVHATPNLSKYVRGVIVSLPESDYIVDEDASFGKVVPINISINLVAFVTGSDATWDEPASYDADININSCELAFEGGEKSKRVILPSKYFDEMYDLYAEEIDDVELDVEDRRISALDPYDPRW